jgi:hypothetical protein
LLKQLLDQTGLRQLRPSIPQTLWPSQNLICGTLASEQKVSGRLFEVPYSKGPICPNPGQLGGSLVFLRRGP